MLPTRLSLFALMLSEIAFLSSSPLKSLKSLSARYLSFNSFGVPTKPSVNAGETQGSASSHSPLLDIGRDGGSGECWT